MKKLLPRSCRRAIAISLAVFSALPVFGRMIDPRGYSFPPYFVFDGVDAVGHVLYVKRIGEIKWTDDSFPVVVRWNSGDKGTSAILGAGWSLPIAESRIVPIDANRFVMRQPDGCERRFSRNPKKPNEIQSGVHRWLGRISGDRIDIWTHPDAPGEKVETRMRCQSGRLTELRMQGAVLAFKYDKGVLAQVDVDGKRQLRVSRSTRRPNEWNFEFADKRLVTAVSGTATLPTDSGMRKGETLKELRFGGAETNVFAYSATKDGRMVFSAPGTSVVWDAKRRTILESGEWKYEIGEAKPVGNNTPMRRVNRDGGVEQDFEDLETGFVVKETVGGEKRIERRFTSGRLYGKTRWCEYYRKGVLDHRVELSYDDVGRVVYSRYRYGSANMEYKGIREFWFNDRDQILRIRENEDRSTDREYIYTPDGINVGVVCGERVVSSQVANIDEFVKWYLAVKRGEKVPCPQIVSVRDAPWPEELRKAIPDWLFQKLTEPKGSDE